MNDVIKNKYKKKSIIYDNMRMYFIKTAKELIKDCEYYKKNILSLEAFKITGNGLQPSQEHSIDFDTSEENWNTAIDFLSDENNSEYVYEIWYEGY